MRHHIPELVEPRPVRVVQVDLAAPRVQDPAPDEDLWLVACRGGVPIALVEVDRDPGAPSIAAQLDLLAVAHPAVDLAWRDLPDQELPPISVVVPSVVRRLGEIESCFSSLDALDYPDYEVVVADNRTVVPDDDPLPALLVDRPRFRAVRAPQPGISAARNAGWVAATGEVVAFTDDDVLVDVSWLRSLGARFAAEPSLQACTGLVLPAELRTPAQIYFERYYGGFAG